MANPQSPSGTQQSSTDVVASDNVPPSKKSRVDEEEIVTDDEEQEGSEDVQASLVSLSETASAFLEAAFGTKLENKTRVAKAQATPDSRWIRCTKIDLVVMANILPAAEMADRAASRLQQFWLDAANPLVFILQKVEELDLPKEVISGIQTALQLMGNANYHHSTAHRQALMLQLNPKLKQLFPDDDSKDAAPYHLENFGAQVKEHLEAAEALKNAITSDKAQQQGFQRSHPQRNSGCGGGSQFSGCAGRS